VVCTGEGGTGVLQCVASDAVVTYACIAGSVTAWKCCDCGVHVLQVVSLHGKCCD
jgi:hypothetical protein